MSVIRSLEIRHHSTTKRERGSRQLKSLKTLFKTVDTADAEAFRQLVRRIERLASLAHDEDECNGLCTLLWFAVEGQDLELYVQAKFGIKQQLSMAVEDIVGYVKIYSTYTMKKRHNHSH